MYHIISTAFDPDAAELALAIFVPPAKGPAAKKARGAPPGTQPPITIAPWLVPSESVPDNWAMTAPPLETLALVRHSMERPIPRDTRYMIMEWCWHRHLRLEDFFA